MGKLKREQFLELQLKALAIFDANNTTMTPNQCAEFLQVHPRTVLNNINNGNIKANHTEGRYQIPKIQFLEQIIWKFKNEERKQLLKATA